MLDTDVQTDPEVEPDDGPRQVNWRRVVRAVTILTLGIVAVLAIWQEPL
ncbi:hypothetical protein [Actinoplanes friuliensis]|jgi:hypothetical protein|uniref:Uncharacterized protein n=1 Tax=Actinoplanes friuliensis DSM 7358 TaxID=1246995 RepID=U5W5L7_9ACTN|nr:hypothetical protein [Actinoplanes friuliensis]AGZ44498.1 hypothetical protein AFR_31190 [Actinoplanes friuliensis DSM 7358]